MYIIYMMCNQPLFNTFSYFDRNCRIYKISDPYFHSRCSSHEKLYSINRIHNTTHSNYRNLYSFSNLPNHSQSYRLDCRSRQSSCTNT